MSWRKLRMGDVCKVFDGPHATPPKSDVGPIYLGITSIRPDGTIDYQNSKRISYEDFPRWTRRVTPQQNDVVFSYEANLNSYAIIPKGFQGCLGRRMAIMRPDTTRILPRFLYYYMYSRQWKKVISERTVLGATVNRIPIASYADFPIEVPSIDIQARIIAVLAAYDKLIENNRKQIALLEEAAQRLYKEWFVDMRFPGYSSANIQDGLPQGWERCTLPEFADIQYGFAFHADNFNTRRDGRPIVRIRNVPTGYSSDYTTEVADEKYIVRDGDILIGMDGVFYINLWHGGEAYLVQRTCCVRPKIEAYRGYLEQAIREPIAAFQNGIVGATVAHLGKKHLDSIHIVVPPASLVGPLDVMAQQRLTLSKEIVMLSEARDRLLPKLMSGEIEV